MNQNNKLIFLANFHAIIEKRIPIKEVTQWKTTTRHILPHAHDA